jgi:ABC-type glycerol-3-phosphate transport system substrate-binding protein
MKKLTFTIGLLSGLCLLFPAFVFAGGGSQGGQQSSTQEASAYSDAPLKDIVPVDALPANPKPIPVSQYAYDDLSKPTAFEILLTNYGVVSSREDPIAAYLGKKYNAAIKASTVGSSDLETAISTRFAAQDYPDVMVISAGLRQISQLLYDNGQLLDAKKAMVYMPNLARYFTKDYDQYISYKGAYTAAPRYPIQGTWDNYLRSDWLKKFGMDKPKTIDELYAYAVKSAKGDPDGNGRADTWFAGGAGNGEGFGMLNNLLVYFGNPNYNVVNGRINHPYLDGTQKNFLAFLKRLNDEGLLAPDWFTVDWESFKSYSLNHKVGFVNYPLNNLLIEQRWANGKREDTNDRSFEVWTPMAPLGSGRAGSPPGPSYMFVFPAKTYNDPVKFKRITHILDNSLFTGEDYWETIQGGGNKVWGKEVFQIQTGADGTPFFRVNILVHPTYNGELDSTGLLWAEWQNIGLDGVWLQGLDENKFFNDYMAKCKAELNGYSRWPNNYLVKIDPDTEADLNNWTKVEIPKFVLGGRDINKWDDFVKEWLDRGGSKALQQAAQQMGAAYTP